MRLKVWLTTAASLVVLGLIVFAGVMTVFDWDFSRLGSAKYATDTYEVNGDFDKIAIHVDTTEITFAPSQDGQCSVECVETEKVKHSATVQNKTLTIDTVDTRKWYDHIGLFFGTMKMTVYLPQDKYVSLLIDTDTGDIDLPGGFTFENIEIKGDTSDVVCLASVSNAIEIELSTGDITVNGSSPGGVSLSTTTGGITIDSVVSKGNIAVETDTGRIKLNDVTCANFCAESDTGTITLANAAAGGGFSIKTCTGDVRLKNCDSAAISIETDTGDVTGTLLSEKVFITATSTGNISVPESTTGGSCEITTSTGDIEISIASSVPALPEPNPHLSHPPVSPIDHTEQPLEGAGSSGRSQHRHIQRFII